MNLYFDKDDYLGKSIRDLEDLVNYQGICIFDMDKIDGLYNHGKRIWEDISIKDFIKEFPDYADAIVEDCNDFFREIVLRIRKQ